MSLPDEPSRPAAAIRPYRILVVEDDEKIRTALARGLTAEGYVVQTACDGLSRASPSTQNEADLVLTDVTMARMDGLELVKRLRGENPDLPIIVLTAHATIEVAVTALRAGARDLLFKPAPLEEIRQSVRRALNIRTLVREEDEVRRGTLRRLVIEIPSREDLVGGIVFEAVKLAKGFYTSTNDLEVRLPLLISEACYNAVEHGNGRDATKKIRFEMEVGAQGLVFSVEDEGEGFAPPSPEAVAQDPSLGLSPRGRGILLMRLYAEEVSFDHGGRKIVIRLA